VASVPITPIRPDRVRSTAARAPGSITPTTGIVHRARIASSATAETELQATTSILMPRPTRNSTFSIE
jgi:hypothetical protein